MNGAQVEDWHQGQLVAQYRKAAGWSQSMLAECLHVSVHTVQRMEREAMIKDPERRRLLVALLGIPALYMKIDGEQLAQQANVLLFNDDPMSSIEDMIDNRWKLHLMGGPLSAFRGLDRTVRGVENFAKEMRGKAWHQRAHTQLCMAYQLRGSVQGDMLQYDKALASYQQAFNVARELQDNELQAAVQVRQAIVFMRQEQPLTAAEYLNGALDLINGEGLPLLRGNILTIRSEAYAKAQRSQEAWRSIGLAERVLEQAPLVRERSHRSFNAALVAAHKGVDALLLGDYRRALALIERSLKTYNPTFTPGRARLLARQAEAYYSLQEIDNCTLIAEEALTLAQTVGASNTVVRIRNLYATLAQSRWKKEPAVVRLGALTSANK
jgi:tetratricopeptide (TPR) repeat protein